MAAFEIREGREEDAPGLCAAHVASIRGLDAPFYRPEQIEAWAGSKRPERYIAAMREGTQFFVGVAGAKLLGFSCLEKDELTGLYLAPEAVGQGLGRALCLRAEEHAREQGYPALRCYSSLQAEGFYRKRGYVEL